MRAKVDKVNYCITGKLNINTKDFPIYQKQALKIKAIA